LKTSTPVKAKTDKRLRRAKAFFEKKLIPASLDKIKECKDPKVFNKTNPFMKLLQAKLMFGDTSQRSLAAALVNLRIGDSLATIYGEKIQDLCVRVLGAKGFGNGFDIKFVDAIDGRTKYCQLKSGPVTLSPSAPQAITEKFFDFIKSNRKNKASIPLTDCVVGVTFGEPSMLSSHYKKIEKYGFPIYVGKDFWHRISGDDGFYVKLQAAFSDAVQKAGVEGVIKAVVDQLCKNPENKKMNNDKRRKRKNS